MSLIKDTTWDGGTSLKQATLSMGSVDKPIQIIGSYVTVSPSSALSGFGEIRGDLSNEGLFMLGDSSIDSSIDFSIQKNVYNSGQIVLGNGKSAGNTLLIEGNYSGNNGRIMFNTVLGGDNSPTDILVVKGNTSGTTTVQVNNIGGTGQKTVNGIKLIDVSGDSAGTFVQDSRIVAGAYDYKLQRGAGENNRNWYLISDLNNSENPDEPNNPHDVTPIIRPEAGAYIGNEAVVHTLFSTRLQDRIGDLWFTDQNPETNKTKNFWIRAQGSYNSWREGSGQLQNRTLTLTALFGNEFVSFSSNGVDRFQIGWMAGYGHGRTKTGNSHSGNGAVGITDGLNAGLTATWYQNGIGQEGAYVDT